MKIVANLSVIALVLVMMLIVATLWATGKSRDRTACYQRATAVSECSQPGPFERWVRAINGAP